MKTLEDQLKKATPDPEQTKKLEATVGKFEKGVYFDFCSFIRAFNLGLLEKVDTPKAQVN